MMCGIQFGFLYGKRNRSVEDKLKIRGAGSIRQSVVKILVMTEFLYVTGLLYYFAGIGIAIRTGTYFVLYQGKIWYVLLLLCLGIAIYFHVLYELSGSSSQAAVFVFAVNVLTIIGAGILIPDAYLGILECICSRNAGRGDIERFGCRNSIFPVCWNGGRDASFLEKWKEWVYFIRNVRKRINA